VRISREGDTLLALDAPSREPKVPVHLGPPYRDQNGRMASHNKRPLRPIVATANPRLLADGLKMRSIREKKGALGQGQHAAAKVAMTTTMNSRVIGDTL
jgi:hypothetical protein